MGLWWKKVAALPEGKGIEIPGQVGSPPKKWWNGWRFRQKRYVLHIGGKLKLCVYFQSASQGVMMYRALISRRYIAVRVGPEPVKFLVTDEFGRVLVVNIKSGPHSWTDIMVMNEQAAVSRSPKKLPYYGEDAILTI